MITPLPVILAAAAGVGTTTAITATALRFATLRGRKMIANMKGNTL